MASEKEYDALKINLFSETKITCGVRAMQALYLWLLTLSSLVKAFSAAVILLNYGCTLVGYAPLTRSSVVVSSCTRQA